MVLVTRSNDAADIVKFLKDQCCPARIIGKIEDNNAMQPSVRFVGMAESW